MAERTGGRKSRVVFVVVTVACCWVAACLLAGCHLGFSITGAGGEPIQGVEARLTVDDQNPIAVEIGSALADRISKAGIYEDADTAGEQRRMEFVVTLVGEGESSADAVAALAAIRSLGSGGGDE